MKKKEKYVLKQGITGSGEDYNVYQLNMGERIAGFFIGGASGFFAAQVLFGVVAASLVVGAIVGVIGVPLFRNFLLKRRKKQILLQFRDMLDSLGSSFSAGRNATTAFQDVYRDLENMYGKKAPMVQELAILIAGMQNNFLVENLLMDMADRCGIEDIRSFADTFGVCNRLGGDLKKIVTESRDIINEKIEIEMEIQTLVASAKNQITVLCLMPFVIVPMMSTLGNDAVTENTPLNVIVKLLAVAIFIGAYFIGNKITEIKI